MDAIFDDHGQVVDRPLFDARVAVVDIGGNTVNLVDLTELRVGDASASRPIGCWRAVTALRRELETHYEYRGIDLSDHDLAAALTVGSVRSDGVTVPLRREVNAILDDMTDAVAAEITHLWGSAHQFDRIFIAGGGGYLIGERLKHRYLQSTVVDRPQLANAHGYWRFARRIAATHQGVSQRDNHNVTHPAVLVEVPHA